MSRKPRKTFAESQQEALPAMQAHERAEAEKGRQEMERILDLRYLAEDTLARLKRTIEGMPCSQITGLAEFSRKQISRVFSMADHCREWGHKPSLAEECRWYNAVLMRCKELRTILGLPTEQFDENTGAEKDQKSGPL